jgi:hypothetical protein
MRPAGGIGRRAGLKHQCLRGHAGSSPALGTSPSEMKGFFNIRYGFRLYTYSISADKYYIACIKDTDQRFAYHIVREFADRVAAINLKLTAYLAGTLFA